MTPYTGEGGTYDWRDSGRHHGLGVRTSADENHRLSAVPGVVTVAVRQVGRQYPDAGYGGSFIQWLGADNAGPYHSWGNGSVMRVSPVGFAYTTEAEVLAQAKASAEITHSHPEGIKGA